MAYTIKITPKGKTEGPTFKMNRDKRFKIWNDIERLINETHNKRVLLSNYGHQALDAYAKLKDGSWKLICDFILNG